LAGLSPIRKGLAVDRVERFFMILALVGLAGLVVTVPWIMLM
jgi:hypothetical protein